MFQFKNLPTNHTQLTAPLVALAIATVCYLLDEKIGDYFVYSRTGVFENEYWRLMTGHLFHTNYAHFLLNSLALILLWALHGKFYTIKSYSILFIFSAVCISSAIYNFDQSMETYVGLSGILHAFFFWGALKDIETKDKTGFILLIGGVAKIIHEQYFGASRDVALLIEANVAVDAHLWGAISGVIVFVLAQQLSKMAHPK